MFEPTDLNVSAILGIMRTYMGSVINDDFYNKFSVSLSEAGFGAIEIERNARTAIMGRVKLKATKGGETYTGEFSGGETIYDA